MKLLVVKEFAAGNLYSDFVAALADAFEDLGHETFVSDQSVHARNGVIPTGPLVADLQAHRPDVVVSFRSMFGGVMLTSGESIFDAWGIKFVGWQFDHPMYVPQALAKALRGRYAIYSSRHHQRFANVLKTPGKGMTLLPGGSKPAAPVKAHADRQWPLVVAATWQGEPRRGWEQVADGTARRLWMRLVERLLEDPEASVLNALERACKDLGIGVALGQDEGFDAAVMPMMREALTHLRQHDRIAILQAIVDEGLPVAICGDGWEGRFGDRTNVTLLPPMPFSQLATLYGEARVLLNLNAANGGSERAVYGALAGAAVVSDFGTELEPLFGRDGAALFDRTRPAAAAGRIAELLEGGASQDMADRGRSRVEGQGLWSHRAEQVLSFVS